MSGFHLHARIASVRNAIVVSRTKRLLRKMLYVRRIDFAPSGSSNARSRKVLSSDCVDRKG